MAPKRRAASGAATAQPASSAPATAEPKTVTIIPPTTSTAGDSKVPMYLKFPLVVLLSFSLSAISHTVYHEVSGTRLGFVSPDGNPQWQLYATIGWRILELGISWFGHFDAHDILSLTLLTRLPHHFLLNTYYEVDSLPLYFLLFTNLLSTTVPFLLLRPLNILHSHLFTQPFPSDTFTSIIATLLNTLTYTLPYLALTTSGFMPRFLATHFNNLSTLEYAHASTLPGTSLLLLPLGAAAARFFLPPASSAFSEAQATTYVLEREFDPVTATLSQTLHRNVLWHLYLPARTQEVIRRIFILAALTVLGGGFWAWIEVEGTEVLGAVGWSSVWAIGAVVTGLVDGYVGGLTDS